MNLIGRRSHTPAAFALILLIALAACDGVAAVPYTGPAGGPAPLLPDSNGTCSACDLATRASALTQQAWGNSDNQAAATAEILRANAQAALNAANATLGAAQTQDQSSANIIAAQIASTAEIEQAHAQATLVAAGATQNAALTQDAIRQTQGADQATTSALAAGTQTAVANGVATQVQSAVATSQWYTDQARQRREQRQIPIGFLWTWGLPTFIVVLAGVVLWGTWRWLKVRRANQRILNGLLEQLPALPPNTAGVPRDDASPYIEGEAVDARYQVTEPEDQVHRWLDEVKHKLRGSGRKDEDDDAHN